jgi:hypothetical protein
MNSQLKTYLNYLSEGFKQRKLMLYFTYVLTKLGVQIVPYYLFTESYQENLKIKLPSDAAPVVCGLLTRPEIEKIYHHPETGGFASLEHEFGYDHCLCFGIKHHQEIMAFSWANLDRCHWGISPFALKKDEAYMFNAYTYKKYRGMNLAPYIRQQFNKYLAENGRTRLYSFTEYFNTPAVNFKKKINAKFIRLTLYIRVFRRFHWNVKIKEYPATYQP